jgi:cell division protein FtsB
MFDFQQKKQFKKVIYSKVSFAVIFFLVIFLARSTYDIYIKYRVSADNVATVKKDYDSLKARKEMLDSEIDRLKTDTGIEEEIRSKFDVAKPGETVVVVINDSSSTLKKTDNSKMSFWAKIWSIFK